MTVDFEHALICKMIETLLWKEQVEIENPLTTIDSGSIVTAYIRPRY